MTPPDANIMEMLVLPCMFQSRPYWLKVQLIDSQLTRLSQRIILQIISHKIYSTSVITYPIYKQYRICYKKCRNYKSNLSKQSISGLNNTIVNNEFNNWKFQVIMNYKVQRCLTVKKSFTNNTISKNQNYSSIVALKMYLFQFIIVLRSE